MSQHVIGCRVDIDGLHIKGVGTFSEGSYFQITKVPPELMKKVQNGEQSIKKGNMEDLCSFLTPDGAYIKFKDAYIPHLNIGIPPENGSSIPTFMKKKKKKIKTSSKVEIPAEIDDEEQESKNVHKTSKKVIIVTKKKVK